MSMDKAPSLLKALATLKTAIAAGDATNASAEGAKIIGAAALAKVAA